MESGYLQLVTEVLLERLEQLPGDQRTQIGFVSYNSSVHFYNLAEGLSQPQMLVVSDLDDVFLPTPDSLLVNLKDSMELVTDLLQNLPNMFAVTGEKGSPTNTDSQSALGAALQVGIDQIYILFLTKLMDCGCFKTIVWCDIIAIKRFWIHITPY